jgi:hypothetical protein
MSNGERRTETASREGGDRGQAERQLEPTRRKPYRAPRVEKRRSLLHATLVSSGGTAGTLAGSGL